MAAHNSLVSVIVPTYNRATTLGRALTSITNQTYQHIEVLVVDDHSDDGTRELLRDCADQDPRIHYLRNTGPQGPSAARNAGLAAASGDYIAFLESDDTWDPEHLARSVVLLEESGLDIVFSDVIQIRDGQASTPHRRKAQIQGFDLRPIEKLANTFQIHNSSALLNAFLDCRPLVYLTTVVYRRSTLPQKFDEEHLIAEDLEFYVHLIIDYGASWGFIDATGTTKYESADSMSRWMEFDPERYYASQLDTYRVLMGSIRRKLDNKAARRLAAQTAIQANNLAGCYRRAGDFRRARKLYTEAFRVAPSTYPVAKAKLFAKILRSFAE